MNQKFKLLSSKEEKQLSVEEKVKYHKQLREYLITRKLKNTTPGATTIAPKLKAPTNVIASKLTKALASKNVEIVCDGIENIKNDKINLFNETVLFAHTHQGILDNFSWIPMIEQHCIILHGREVNPLLLGAQLNTGLVFAMKENPEYNREAKLDMISLLSQGHSLSYFPEGTWNLSPNKLHLPMRYGFLDIACKAQVPVVPFVHEFTYDTSNQKERITKIHSRFGKPIYVTEKDNLIEKLEEYKEIISTIRYDLIDEKGLFNRSQVSNWDYINYLKGNYKNLALGQLDWEKERRNIYGAQEEFYVFHPINDVLYDEFGYLLGTEEEEKLKTLNFIHLGVAK